MALICEPYHAVVVAVDAVREMQMPRDEVIDMIAMGDSLVAAAGAVAMVAVMSAAGMRGGTGSRVGRTDGEGMLIHMVVVHVMQVSVVQVILVIVVVNGAMAAVLAVLMAVMVMNPMVAHRRAPFVLMLVRPGGI